MANTEHGLRKRIYLLRSEFSRFLNPSDVIFKIQGLKDELVEEINNLARQSRSQAVEKLIDVVAEDDGLIEKFVWALSDTGYKRFTHAIEGVYPDRGQSFCQDYFGFLINMMRGDLIDKLSSIDVCGFLYENKAIEDTDMEAIRAARLSGGDTAASQELFLRLPRRDENWPILFIEALKHTEGQEYLKEKIDPSATLRELEEAGIDVPSTDQVAETFVTSNQTDVVNSGEDEEDVSSVHDSYTGEAEIMDEADPGSDYEEEKYMKEASEKDDNKPREVNLRGYQYELAEKAVDGKNTVICADTGSGKTWVALHIVREHLKQRGRGKAKVAFMARTNPLVQQQFTLFKHYLGKDFVYIINKDEKTYVPLKKLLEQYDVFFFTPQILINNIEKGETRISDFSLLILDECHHTHKGEPYNNLMRKYIKTKRNNPEVRLPQIVGMTASVGVGQATTEDGAIGHMVKIFSNLDLKEISTVENPRNKEEMKQFVPIPSEEHVKMKADYVDQCNSIIIEEIDGIGKQYENILKKKPVPNTRYNLPGGNYLSKTYLGSIIKLKNQLMCDTTLGSNGREMISCLTHLSILHEALDINYLMNMEHVVQFLDKKYQEEEQQEERLIQIEKRLLRQGQELIRRLQTQPDIKPNPNLRMIEEKLQELFAEAGENSLGMIFVQTRATAKSLAEYLDEELEAIHIPVKPFIGSKAADSGDGLTETEKKELLDEFRNHKVKLLVATSVGSEGIDVPECNIVMKYNYSGNEINIIQMRGRTRKAGGQAIYISDHNVLRRDLMSIEKAALMHKALDQLKEKGPEELRRLIDTEQTNSLKELEEEERKNRNLQNAKRTGSFKLVCARCNDTEIDGRSIRLYKQNHHVVADRGFLERVKKKDIKEETKVNQMIKKSEIFCKECPQKLGKIFLIHGLEVPLLKIEAFLCQEGEKLRKYKNWKLVPYKIDEINYKDLEAIFPKQILS